MEKKLIKKINELVKTQKYDENVVLTLLEISNVSRRLAELMLLKKHNENTKQSI